MSSVALAVSELVLGPGESDGPYRYLLGNEQWLLVLSGRPTLRHLDGVEVLEPSELYNEDGTFNKDSLKTRLGVAERSFDDLKQGDIVQFLRYGFVRVDAPSRCVLTHG